MHIQKLISVTKDTKQEADWPAVIQVTILLVNIKCNTEEPQHAQRKYRLGTVSNILLYITGVLGGDLN